LARVSDHFEFKGDYWCINDENGYDGTWQISVRDIDPSCLLKNTKSDNTNDLSWWSHGYQNLDFIALDMEWLEHSDDLPNTKLFIDIIKPNENSRWLALENSIRLNKKLHTNSNDSISQQRQIIYKIHSYLVYKEDMNDLYEWAIQQDFSHELMPRSHEQMGFFVGEFCWSPAFKCHNIPYFSHYGWTQGNDDRIPRKVLVSTDIYWKETGYDCSIDESYSIYLPCQWLVDEMNLQWNGVAGHFYNEHGELTVFDPSINDSGANSCLINRDIFLSFLERNNYDILWTVEIKKQILDKTTYPSRTFSGAFRIKNGELEGQIKKMSR
jgi:hypothetical protein